MNSPFLVFNNKGEASKKVLIQIFALILFIIIIIFTIGKKTEDNKNNDTQNKNLSSSPTALNNAFLSEVPLNEKSSIYKTGRKTLNTGELIEELIVFNSKKTVLENQKFYEDWAQANNWKVGGTVSKENNISLLSFSKNKKELQISLEQGKNNSAKITMIYSNM